MEWKSAEIPEGTGTASHHPTGSALYHVLILTLLHSAYLLPKRAVNL